MRFKRWIRRLIGKETPLEAAARHALEYMPHAPKCCMSSSPNESLGMPIVQTEESTLKEGDIVLRHLTLDDCIEVLRDVAGVDMYYVTADKVADYLLWFAHDKGDLLTNLKLQKLVYYAQSWYLTLYDEPLFEERFEAWVHGPIQPALYRRFDHYKWNPISYHPARPDLSMQVEEHLTEIIAVFGDLSSYALERMVHAENPWRNARKGLAPDEASNEIISRKDMVACCKGLLRNAVPAA